MLPEPAQSILSTKPYHVCGIKDDGSFLEFRAIFKNGAYCILIIPLWLLPLEKLYQYLRDNGYEDENFVYASEYGASFKLKVA